MSNVVIFGDEMLTLTPKEISAICDANGDTPIALTVGYQGLRDASHLADVLSAIGDSAVLVDVRKVPAGGRVNKLFQQGAIKAAIGDDRYVWKGNVLGGLSRTGENVTAEGISWLHDTINARRVLLLCACENPAKCHVQTQIVARMYDRELGGGPRMHEIGHLVRDAVYDGRGLREALDSGQGDVNGDYVVWTAP